ncbi:MAG: RNA-directed DNA polymerase [Bacteroidetes bacterium]|nr:RNA-directed DNA polymerase [Bacteroidota bacterium]
MIKSKKIFSLVLGYELKTIDNIIECLEDEQKRGKYYNPYKVKKSGGKFRVIAPSRGELKKIQARIHENIFSHIQLPFYVTGSLKRRSGVINGKIHSGKKYHFQTDLVNFFGFVSYRNVLKALKMLGFSHDVAFYITKLTTYDGHLPQGVCTSPFLANLVGLNIDDAMLDFCKSRNITYSRYVDDLTFSSQSDFKDELKIFLSGIIAQGFIYSYRKTKYKIGSIDVTGTKVTNEGIKGTDKQYGRALLIDTKSSSFKGLVGHLEYVEEINDKFNLTTYRNENIFLRFPTRLFPYMNFKKKESK